jgi:hypothetical protein
VERPVLASYTTSYVPTAYYATPSYRATSLALADRLVVPTAYLTAADCICPPAVASAAPAYAAPSRGTGTAVSGTDSRARTRQGQADVRESVPSTVGPPPDYLAPYAPGVGNEGTTAGREGTPGAAPESAATTRDTSPTPPKPAPPAGRTTNPPAGTRQGTPGAATPGTTQDKAAAQGQGGAQPTTGTGQPGQTGRGASEPAPTAPDGVELPAAPGLIEPPGTTRRDSLRPNYTMTAARPRYANILMGTVLSSSDGQPEEGVQIRVRNAATGGGKTTTTNAFGRFAVRVADGEWAVDVTMPSGRTYEVSQLRVSDGVITDSQGRRIPSLEITR